MDIHDHNRRSWNRQSAGGTSRWSRPVSRETTEAARQGRWEVILTPNRTVPPAWFGDVRGKSVLCLASGGGQQAPILAAAGADVVSFDASEEQLTKDALVAERDGLSLRTVRGDMADLSAFSDEQFDLIVHPISNVFVRDVRPVWRECYRVLRLGGRLLAGFMNPCFYLFDHEALERGGPFEVRFALPYSDLTSLPPDMLQARVTALDTLEFGHSLDEQIGGQAEAGFVIAGLYEDRWDEAATRLDAYMPTSIATLALKIRI
jgi:SAM-dependent methyltransferase